MYDIDFLPIGNGTRSGDAILLRFTGPDTGTLAHVIIDAGFQTNGDDVVEHIDRYYDTRAIDLAIVTHPDGDHIGGMGTVLNELNVGALAVHRLAAHGGKRLDASPEIEKLCQIAARNGTDLYEPFTGLHAFGGALMVAGPTASYYEQLVADQLREETTAAALKSRGGRIIEAAQRLAAQVVQVFPMETDFDDADGANPRNNSSAIVDLRLPEGRFFFTGDAGVPAINNALDYLDGIGRTDRWPDFTQIPHHGSRHNLDRATIARLVGPHRPAAAQTAFISIASAAAADPRYPSPRITNAFGRRGYSVAQTAGGKIRKNSPDAPARSDYYPLAPIPPKDETIDDR